LLHLVGSSVLLVLYVTDDARSNKNQVYIFDRILLNPS